MNTSCLETRALTIGYRQGRHQYVVGENLELSLARGELVCLIGPNGAGKSTLLRTLAGLHPQLQGTILIEGRLLSELSAREIARCLSVVLTDRIDAGYLSAHALVTLGRYPYTSWTGELTEEDDRVVVDALRSVGALELAERNVGSLSDGERQKVMIARALAQDPSLMVLDEPTAFLDLPRRAEILHLLKMLARQKGRTVLLSTHDLDLALRSADRLWIMTAHHAIYTGAPEDLVLSGTLEKAFEDQEVRFDREQGAFIMKPQSAGEVGLVGDGSAALWTRRALEREGYVVVAADSDCPLFVEVLERKEATSWRLFRRNGSSGPAASDHASIYDLVGALSRRQD